MLRFIGVIFFIAAIFFIIINALPEPEGFPILEYHTVTKNPDPSSEIYNVPPAEFSAQLDYLQENGYTTITLNDYIKARRFGDPLPPKPIILTFDDGYADNYSEMLPILEAHGMTAVIFVITNEINKHGYLTLDQLKDLQRRGIEIGSHTADHLPLVTLNDEFLINQIRVSKIFLEWSGLNPIASLSYPNGVYNTEIIEMLKTENYLAAVTGEAGLNTLETDPYKLRRVHIRKPRFGIFEFRWRLLKANIFERLKNL
ncbi:MAG: polysaccharide deacetylase family protein [Selenomonadaceae bacterium]|nr:polysaccharide deacetylase family protein [Selenomonadaceae bacterium]